MRTVTEYSRSLILHIFYAAPGSWSGRPGVGRGRSGSSADRPAWLSWGPAAGRALLWGPCEEGRGGAGHIGRSRPASQLPARPTHPCYQGLPRCPQACSDPRPLHALSAVPLHVPLGGGGLHSLVTTCQQICTNLPPSSSLLPTFSLELMKGTDLPSVGSSQEATRREGVSGNCP